MKSSKSSLFLMELIISILFFSLASAVCIQLFAKSHLLDQKTKRQNQTVIWAENLASLWQSSEGDLYTVYTRLQSDYAADDSAVYLTNPGTSILLYLDKDFNLTGSSADIAYIITLEDHGFDASTQLFSVSIDFSQNGESFYNLDLKYHPAAERGTSAHE